MRLLFEILRSFIYLCFYFFKQILGFFFNAYFKIMSYITIRLNDISFKIKFELRFGLKSILAKIYNTLKLDFNLIYSLFYENAKDTLKTFYYLDEKIIEVDKNLKYDRYILVKLLILFMLLILFYIFGMRMDMLFINYAWLAGYIIYFDFYKDKWGSISKKASWYYSIFQYAYKKGVVLHYMSTRFGIFKPERGRRNYYTKFLVKASKFTYRVHPFRDNYFITILNFIKINKVFKLESNTLNKAWGLKSFSDLGLIIKVYNEDLKADVKGEMYNDDVISNVLYFLYNFFDNFDFNKIILYFENSFRIKEDLYLNYFYIFFYNLFDFFINNFGFLIITVLFHVVIFYKSFLDFIFYIIQDFFFDIKYLGLNLDIGWSFVIYIKHNFIFNWIYNDYFALLRTFIIYLFEYNKYIYMYMKVFISRFINAFDLNFTDFHIFKYIKVKLAARKPEKLVYQESNFEVLRRVRDLKRLKPRVRGVLMRAYIINKKLGEAPFPYLKRPAVRFPSWLSSSIYSDFLSNRTASKNSLYKLPDLRFTWFSGGGLLDYNFFGKLKIYLLEKFIIYFKAILNLLLAFFIFGIYLYFAFGRSVELFMDTISYDLYKMYIKVSSDFSIIFRTSSHIKESFLSTIKKSYYVDDSFYDLTSYYVPSNPELERDKRDFYFMYTKVVSLIKRSYDRYTKYEVLNIKHLLLKNLDDFIIKDDTFTIAFQSFYRLKFFNNKLNYIFKLIFKFNVYIYSFFVYTFMKVKLLKATLIYLEESKVYNTILYKFNSFREILIISGKGLIYSGNYLKVLFTLSKIDFNNDVNFITNNKFFYIKSYIEAIEDYAEFFQDFDLLSLKLYKQVTSYPYDKRLLKFYTDSRFDAENTLLDLKTQYLKNYKEDYEDYLRQHMTNNQFIFIISRLIFLGLVICFILYCYDVNLTPYLYYNLFDIDYNFSIFTELMFYFINHVVFYFDFMFYIISMLVELIFKFYYFLKNLYFVNSTFVTTYVEVRQRRTFIWFSNLKRRKFERFYRIYNRLFSPKYSKFIDSQNVSKDRFFSDVIAKKGGPIFTNIFRSDFNLVDLDRNKKRNYIFFFKFFIINSICKIINYLRFCLKSAYFYVYETYWYGKPVGIALNKNIIEAKKKIKFTLYEYLNVRDSTKTPMFYEIFMDKVFYRFFSKDQMNFKSGIFRNKVFWNRYERSDTAESIGSYKGSDTFRQFYLFFRSFFETFFNMSFKPYRAGRWVDPYVRELDKVWQNEDFSSFYKRKGVRKRSRLKERDVLRTYEGSLIKSILSGVSRLRPFINETFFKKSAGDVEIYNERPFPLYLRERLNPKLYIWEVFMFTPIDKYFSKFIYRLQEFMGRTQFIHHKVFKDVGTGLKTYIKLVKDYKPLMKRIHRDIDKDIPSIDGFYYRWNDSKGSSNYSSHKTFQEDFIKRKVNDITWSNNFNLLELLERYFRYSEDMRVRDTVSGKSFSNLSKKKRRTVGKEKVSKLKKQKTSFMTNSKSLFFNYINEWFYSSWQHLRNNKFTLPIGQGRGEPKKNLDSFARKRNHFQRVLVGANASRLNSRTAIGKLLQKRGDFVEKTKLDEEVSKERGEFTSEFYERLYFIERVYGYRNYRNIKEDVNTFSKAHRREEERASKDQKERKKI